jgi:hypothetical protein
MEEIYIFDLDGCVMPPIFSNFVDRRKSRDKLVDYVEKNGYKVSLFSSFLRFYEKHCRNAKSIIFITGRKKSEFGKLTDSQLNPLTTIKSYNIIYYPEEKVNRAQEYFDWKTEEIEQILKREIENSLNYKENFKVKIFDDLVKHFPRLKKIAKNLDLRVAFFKIKGEKSWTSLIRNLL